MMTDARGRSATTSIRVAAAQSQSAPGDLAGNLEEHLRFVDAAHRLGVDVLVFPELSLTGYELPLLRTHALPPEADVFRPIRERAERSRMTLVVGAPIANGEALPFIGALVFRGDGGADVYRKQYPTSKERVFAAADEPHARVHEIAGERVAFAICADLNEPLHAAAAREAGASLYLAGVLISEEGHRADAAALRERAAVHGMAVLMANHGAPSGGYRTAGRSAFWAPGGELVVAAPGAGRYLVVASRTAAGWAGEVKPVDG